MKKYVNIILLILWMALIFTLSNYSAVESSSQSGLITTLLSKILKINNIEILEVIIRKSAHLFEYILLGILTINFLKDYKINKLIFISIFIGSIYACTDEIHQLFIPGRSCQISDIFIDSIGVSIGVFLYIYIYKLFKYKKTNKV